MRRLILLGILVLCACSARSSQNTPSPQGEETRASQAPGPMPEPASALPSTETAVVVPCTDAASLSPSELPTLRQIRQPMAMAKGAKTVVAISAEYTRTCALDCAGAVYCWQLINEQDEEEPEYYEFSPPKRNMLGVDLVALSATSGHICGLTKEGTVVCKGSNSSGELGVGTNDSVQGLARPKGLAGASSVIVRSNNSCATTAGNTYCWGENFSNSLGLGPQESQSRPQFLPGIQSVAIDHSHSCGVTKEGLVSCWGARNAFHELGCEKGSPDCGGMAVLTRTSPRVSGVSQVKSVAVGGDHSCALTSAGAVYCWGSNDAGESGGQPDKKPWHPRKVDGLPKVRAISVSGSHGCALTEEGALYCWGDNLFGQTGLAAHDEYRTPKRIMPLPPVREMSLGTTHTCVLTRAGQVICWGVGVDPRD